MGLSGSVGSLDSLAVEEWESKWEGVVGVVGRELVPVPAIAPLPRKRERAEEADDEDDDRVRVEEGLRLAEAPVRRRVRSGRMVSGGTFAVECDVE